MDKINFNEYGYQTWTFHIQSVEDFYNQLREYHRQDLERESFFDVENIELAKSMLKEIGVNV